MYVFAHLLCEGHFQNDVTTEIENVSRKYQRFALSKGVLRSLHTSPVE